MLTGGWVNDDQVSLISEDQQVWIPGRAELRAEGGGG